MFVYLAEVLRVVIDEAQGVLGEGVKDVQAVDLVALGNGKIKADQGQEVWLWNTKRSVQTCDEVRHLVKADELSCVRVESKK